MFCCFVLQVLILKNHIYIYLKTIIQTTHGKEDNLNLFHMIRRFSNPIYNITQVNYVLKIIQLLLL